MQNIITSEKPVPISAGLLIALIGLLAAVGLYIVTQLVGGNYILSQHEIRLGNIENRQEKFQEAITRKVDNTYLIVYKIATVLKIDTKNIDLTSDY